MFVSKVVRGVVNTRSARSIVPASQQIVSGVVSEDVQKRLQSRSFHMSTRKDNQLIVGGLVVFTAAASAHYALVAYKAYAAQKAAEAAANPTSNESKKESSSEEKTGFFDTLFARNYYDGGFEEKMTRREAALILGVRESATADRIKDQHRKVLLLNHPDKGGSAYLSSKINEAKDLLMKTKDAGK